MSAKYVIGQEVVVNDKYLVFKGVKGEIISTGGHGPGHAVYLVRAECGDTLWLREDQIDAAPPSENINEEKEVDNTFMTIWLNVYENGAWGYTSLEQAIAREATGEIIARTKITVKKGKFNV